MYFASVGDHAAELKNLDGLSALANSFLRIHRTARRFKADERTHNGDRDKQQYAHQKD